MVKGPTGDYQMYYLEQQRHLITTFGGEEKPGLGVGQTSKSSLFSYNTLLAMASAFFTKEQEYIINANPVAKIINQFYDHLPPDIAFDQYNASAASDEGTCFSNWLIRFSNKNRCQAKLCQLPSGTCSHYTCHIGQVYGLAWKLTREAY